MYVKDKETNSPWTIIDKKKTRKQEVYLLTRQQNRFWHFGRQQIVL